MSDINEIYLIYMLPSLLKSIIIVTLAELNYLFILLRMEK